MGVTNQTAANDTPDGKKPWAKPEVLLLDDANEHTNLITSSYSEDETADLDMNTGDA